MYRTFIHRKQSRRSPACTVCIRWFNAKLYPRIDRACMHWYALFFDQALSPACDCIETFREAQNLARSSNCNKTARDRPKNFFGKMFAIACAFHAGCVRVRSAKNSSKTNYPHVERVCGVTNVQART